MSLDMNSVFYGGRLTDDPAPLGEGKGCKFDVASNRTYKNKDGERVEDTTYMPITCWGTLAEIVLQRCRKGSSVVVEGRIEVRKFDSDDGTPRKYVNIVAKDVRFESQRSNEGQAEARGRSLDEELPSGVDPKAAALIRHILGQK